MTQGERVTVGEALAAMAQMYGRDLTRGALTLMLDTIEGLPSALILAALNSWVQESKLNRMPVPAEIIAKVRGEPASREALGREIASRIVGAVSKFGWPNGKEAREFIGEDGWVLVERSGGWSELCQGLGVTLDVQTFQAQARDLLTSHVEFKDKGVSLDRLPRISDRGSNSLSPIGQLVPGKGDER